MKTNEYKKITMDKKIYSIDNKTYRGYWEGKYIDDKTYKGVYTDLNMKTKNGPFKFKWDDLYQNGTFYWESGQSLIEKIELDKKKIDDSQDVDFDELLWTHNMPLSVFYNMFTDENSIKGLLHNAVKSHAEKVLRTNSNDEKATEDINHAPSGIQFRYGVDSQYGDVIFIMKPGFFYKYNKNDDARVWRIFPNTHDKIDRRPTNPTLLANELIKNLSNKQLKNELKKDASFFKFRQMSSSPIDSGDVNYTGINECMQDQWNNSWCNHQLHLFEDVSFKDVKCVLLPHWITTHDFEDQTIKNNIQKILSFDISIYKDNLEHLKDKYKFYGTNIFVAESFYTRIN
jgi:hypothetical protein